MCEAIVICRAPLEDNIGGLEEMCWLYWKTVHCNIFSLFYIALHHCIEALGGFSSAKM